MAISASIKQYLRSCSKVAEWAFPDQDFLSEFFKGKWKPIAWYYNALRSLHNTHPELWADHEIRCLHYIFADKPWQSRITPEGSEPGFDVMNRWWWERFDGLGAAMAKKDPDGWQILCCSIESEKRTWPNFTIFPLTTILPIRQCLRYFITLATQHVLDPFEIWDRGQFKFSDS